MRITPVKPVYKPAKPGPRPPKPQKPKPRPNQKTEVIWMRLELRNGNIRIIPVIKNQKKVKFEFIVRKHRR